MGRQGLGHPYPNWQPISSAGCKDVKLHLPLALTGSMVQEEVTDP